MAEITAGMIKDLRERTGVGMGKCKEALVETNGDIEAAVDLLRKSGMASAVKKSAREANEGKIGVAETGENIAIVEVNAETDFVVNNEKFQKFVQDIADEIAHTKPASLESFLAQKFSKDSSLTIDEFRATLVQAIGENIQISRFVLIPKRKGHSVAAYSHSGGKIVTLVDIGGGEGKESLSRDIAMHVAAASPEYLNPQSVPADVIQRERDIAKEQVKGKPENITEKIVDGKIKAFYDMACLLNQRYIKDDAVTIEDYVKKNGSDLAVNSFIRWTVGQK
jgi:elongation factor Ts